MSSTNAEKICVVCDEPFTLTKTCRKTKRTCSRSCSTILGLRNRTHKTKCVLCGDEFAGLPDKYKYCKPKHLAVCYICGEIKEFTNKFIEIKGDILVSTVGCSTKCSMNKRQQNNKYNKKCVLCGDEFITTTHHRKYCKSKHEASCLICGNTKEFTSKFVKKQDNVLVSTKACSTQCSVKKGKQNRKQKAICPLCDIEFIKMAGGHKYCKPQHLAICFICGETKEFKNKFIEKKGDVLVSTKACNMQCGKTFVIQNNEDIKHVYSGSYNTKLGLQNSIQKIKCSLCNSEFIKKSSNHKYCKPKHLAACPICIKTKEFDSSSIERKGNTLVSTTTCSIKCSIEKSKQTNLEKYGVEYPLQSKKIREKYTKTSLEKYGTEHPTQTKQVQDKKNQTNLERYGTEYPVRTKETQDKFKQTMLERYGVENPSQSKEIQDKIKVTNLERYGSENVFASDYGKEKIKETMLERYGKEFYSQTDEFKKKFKQTSLERYGVENPMQIEEIEQKRRKTYQEKYGADYYVLTDEFKEKSKQTSLANYGTEFPAQSKEMQDRIKATNLKKYGYTSYSKTQEFKDNLREYSYQKYGTQFPNQYSVSHLEDWHNLEEFVKQNSMTVAELTEYFGISTDYMRKNIYEKDLMDDVVGFYTISTAEDSFKLIFDKHFENLEYNIHDRQVIHPFELDFYIPEYKIGIEISPTWIHQYKYSDDMIFGKEGEDYHYNKFKMCEEQGVELITVFDWMDIDDVIKSIEQCISYRQNNKFDKIEQIKVKRSTNENAYKEFINVEDFSSYEIFDIIIESNTIGIAICYTDSNSSVILDFVFFDKEYSIFDIPEVVLKDIQKEVNQKDLIVFSDNNFGSGLVYKDLKFNLLSDTYGALLLYNDKNDILMNTNIIINDNIDLNKVVADIKTQQYIKERLIPIIDCGYRVWKY